MAQEIFVTQSSMPQLDEYIDEIRDLWETRWLTNMGNKHKELQERLCDFLMVPYVELLTNGHMALELSLQALKLSGEVITTPYTFASTTHAIMRNGLTPVFCDINPNDFTIDVKKIEKLITEKTTAILPVHVYGNVCDVEGIEQIARKYKLKVIYDAAHAFGVKYKDKGIGSYGDAACFSFHATKVFNTIEGGAVCFKDVELGRKIYGLKNFGIRGPETVDAVGTNAKMNEFCAAMGICNLKHIKEEIKKRKKIFEYYNLQLKGMKGIKLLSIQDDVVSNYAYFPIVIDEEIFGCNRDTLHKYLADNGIITRKYFYPLTNTFECFTGLFDVTETPIALDISTRVLTLPLYSDLEIEVVEKICDLIKEFHK